MLFQHNPHSFLSGEEPFLPTTVVEEGRDALVQELVFEPRHEGFIGIPHGGIAMGLCLDAWRRVGVPSYPVTVRFKFGGSGLGIGEPAMFEVEHKQEHDGPTVVARITKFGDKTPYLRTEIRSASGPAAPFPLERPPAPAFRELPYYRNCFVCGHHRNDLGLQRRFRSHSSDDGPVTSVPWGQQSDDFDRARFFTIGNGELHPVVLLSIFDENTAWAGFMETRSAGLSVRMEVTLYRPVGIEEELLFVAKPKGIRGNPKAPRFFLAEGSILSMSDPLSPVPVAHGRGEWVIMEQYTRQITKNLLPADDWQWIFGENAF